MWTNRCIQLLSSWYVDVYSFRPPDCPRSYSHSCVELSRTTNQFSYVDVYSSWLSSICGDCMDLIHCLGWSSCVIWYPGLCAPYYSLWTGMQFLASGFLAWCNTPFHIRSATNSVHESMFLLWNDRYVHVSSSVIVVWCIDTFPHAQFCCSVFDVLLCTAWAIFDYTDSLLILTYGNCGNLVVCDVQVIQASLIGKYFRLNPSYDLWEVLPV